MVVLKDARECSCHECLAKADHVANDYATAFVQVVRGNLHCCPLVLEKLVEVVGNAELSQASSRLLGEVVGHLDVDVKGRNWLRACPTIVDDLDEFLGDVYAEAIIPAVFKPLRQFVACVVVQNIDVEFPLLGQSGQGQVAALENPSLDCCSRRGRANTA